ncbi:PWWP domain-containing DNA repair factor 3A isoform X2 [Mixophyes fleayi]|uniref:PWWP domain-containing DNA repair factor 3A isoform X2 n=1 Tax=Mixophyes fleayi TaxID=3061075 RepID=UPI003F4E33B5
MEFPKYIFCKWESRFWPAKVLSKPKRLSRNSKLMVEIFTVNEQITVKSMDTKPFLMVELDNIAKQLDSTEHCKVTNEELTYRNALREAVDIMTLISTAVTEGVEVPKETISTASQICKKTEATTGRKKCESSRTINKQKKALKRSTVKGDLKNVKGGRDSSTATTNEHSMCPKRPSRKTLSPTNLKPVHTQVKHITDEQMSKKRPRDTEQDELLCGKETATNVLSHSNIPVDQQWSHKSENSLEELKGCPAKKMDNFITPGVSDDCGSGKIRPVLRRPRLAKMNKVQKTIKKTQVESSVDNAKRLDIHAECTPMQHPIPDFEEARGLSSSDLSMEISSPECSFLHAVSPQEDTEEDIQLPVIALQKEPVSFTPGAFVWCKFQRFPYWPSLVQTVKNKHKKASIIFLEASLTDPKEKKKSFAVAFRTLKHYDCSEKQQLLESARKDYGKFIDWCDSLICDYRISLGCGSFSGSFLDYCTAAISLPVRRELESGNSWVFSHSIEPEIRELQPEIADSKSHVNRKVLPDRKRAARDRANEKLVEFIVKTKRAENHLIDILKGKKKSQWLKKFQSSIQRVNCLETYIEDEEQMELVVGYLQTLCSNMSSAVKKLMNGDQTRFILEVLLPEAVIFAISATDQINYEKAENKYINGPSVTKRERKIFEEQILEKKRLSENLESDMGSN